jgi:hypothetical protein
MSRDRKQSTTSVPADIAPLPTNAGPPNTSVVLLKPPTPVRVRLRRVSAGRAVAYPPDGAEPGVVAEMERRLWYRVERLRRCFTAAANGSRSASAQWNF